MSGLIIGGFIPAFLWGVTAILQKKSSDALVYPDIYLIVFGTSTAIAGALATLFSRHGFSSIAGLTFAALAGLSFSVGTGLIGYSLFVLGTPVSKLAPIWSCNALVTVALGSMMVNEAVHFGIWKLGTGAMLIVLGAILVGSA